MSAMSDLHIENMNLEADWLKLLVAILERTEGRASIMKPMEGPADEEEWEQMRWVPDIALTPRMGGKPIAVELKMFRWRNDWKLRINDAVAYMQNLVLRGDFGRGILILSLELDEDEARVIEGFKGDEIEIWDLKNLRDLIADDPELLDQLEQMVSDTDLDDRPFVVRRPIALKRGADIASRLRDTPAGRPGWQEFETICHEAIRFLFGRELQKLVPQNVTYDTLHRMDLIGRIRPESESFWAMLASDFSSRYVVFEAKNYVQAIGQSAIDITAKYLFRAGLRTVAIVIAREGASSQATSASAGHLREDRKFIMVISMNDMCRMLEGADAGDPPENVLFDRMDETLMAMGR